MLKFGKVGFGGEGTEENISGQGKQPTTKQVITGFHPGSQK